ARFIERADDNGDGLLEFSEMGPDEERAANRFERIDTDGSGGISQEEMETAREARQERGWRPFGGDRG
ncbi:MAG: calcium-binding protein, partial [Pseudomonadota bacterium]